MDGENAVPTPEQQPADDRVTLTRDEYLALRSSHEQVAKERQTLQSRVESIEAQYRAERIGGVVRETLSGVQWREGGMETAVRLLGSELEVRTDATGAPAVVHRGTGQPAQQYLAEALNRPPFTHLQAATSRGGSGATNAPPPGSSTGFIGGQVPGASNPFEAQLMQAHIGQIRQPAGIPGFGRNSLAK